jgi:hypothetical protein
MPLIVSERFARLSSFDRLRMIMVSLSNHGHVMNSGKLSCRTRWVRNVGRGCKCHSDPAGEESSPDRATCLAQHRNPTPSGTAASGAHFDHGVRQPRHRFLTLRVAQKLLVSW